MHEDTVGLVIGLSLVAFIVLGFFAIADLWDSGPEVQQPHNVTTSVVVPEPDAAPVIIYVQVPETPAVEPPADDAPAKVGCVGTVEVEPAGGDRHIAYAGVLWCGIGIEQHIDVVFGERD